MILQFILTLKIYVYHGYYNKNKNVVNFIDYKL